MQRYWILSPKPAMNAAEAVVAHSVNGDVFIDSGAAMQVARLRADRIFEDVYVLTVRADFHWTGLACDAIEVVAADRIATRVAPSRLTNGCIHATMNTVG